MNQALCLLLANLALVKFIGLEQFNDRVSFRLFFKKTNFSFVLISAIYTVSYPFYSFFNLSFYSYLQPLLYILISYCFYWLLNYLKQRYDYWLVLNPSQLRFDLFYQTLIAGSLFFIFSLKVSFLAGLGSLFIGYLTYLLAYILWMGLAKKIVSDIYVKASFRYWAMYLSLLLLCLFFTCLVICQTSLN